MRVRTGLVIAGLALSCGCGAAAPRTARIAPLPELPFALERGPRELRSAWSRAELLLSEPTPQPPSEGFATVDEAGTWANEVVMPWTHDYLERLPTITDPLAGAIALDPSLRVFAASITALLYERLLDVLFDMPVPRDIAGDAELVSAYREVFTQALGSTVGDTRGFLEECVATAGEREGAEAWGTDCAARAARLP